MVAEDISSEIQWLALHNLPGIGPVQANRILDLTGSVTALFQAPPEALETCFKGESLAVWLDFQKNKRSSKLAQKALRDQFYLNDKKLHLLTKDDANYPFLLKQISSAPPVLYVNGDLSLLAKPQIAVVGSRKVSPSGRDIALQISADLVKAGLCVTSGMALGVDAAAHLGAIGAGGKTLAVQATGLDRIYPARHRDLAEKIVSNGALISEFPLGTPPRPDHFPRRNRLISGLSQGVVIIEATKKSGTLVTARYAIEQNREVFAVPGTPGRSGSEGPNNLIKEGATLVEHAGDILSALNIGADAHTSPLFSGNEDATTRLLKPVLSSIEEKVLAETDVTPRCIDQIVLATGLNTAAVVTSLVSLELKNCVLLVNGGYIRS